MLKKIKSVYIIGIGGISLSAIAVFLEKEGIKIYGSDINDSQIIHSLIERGYNIKIGNAPEFVKKTDILVYTSAVDAKNSDIKLAKQMNKPVYSRAEILGVISQKFQTISVAGTHGKTTTTGMISNILLSAGKDPSIHIGGVLNNINSNVHIGKGDIFVTEACEYKDSFLSLKNHIAIVLNVQEDHLDYFKNLDEIFDSFQKFVKNTDKNGVFIYNFDDFLSKSLKSDCKKISFGLSKDCDLRATHIKEYANGQYSFDVEYLGENYGRIYLPCFGKHNIYNALAAIAVGFVHEIDFESIKNGIETFKGIKRRFEFINKIGDNLIIHDYAHHPDEIKATINACLEVGYEKLIVIFQPHTFTRTKSLYNEFLSCFKDADEVWLLPIYPAREKPIKGVSSFKLCQDLKKNALPAKYFKSFDDCRDKILDEKGKTLFAILGAGDIVELAESLRQN